MALFDWWTMMCDENDRWHVAVETGAEPGDADLDCPHGGAVTARLVDPGDYSMVCLVPAVPGSSTERAPIPGFPKGAVRLVLLDASGRVVRASERIYELSKASELRSRFELLPIEQAANRWDRAQLGHVLHVGKQHLRSDEPYGFAALDEAAES